MNPSGFDIYLKYSCDCGMLHYLTLEESKGPFVIVCGVCNKRHQIKPIKSVKVLINFCKSLSKTIAKPVPVPQDLVRKAYGILKNYSYSLEEVQQYSGKIKATTAEDFIKEFLAVQK